MGSQVPGWAVENRARFLRATNAAGERAGKPPIISAASVYRSLYSTEALTRAGLTVDTADGSGMLITAPRISPPPVNVRPEEAYYRDENNHPDILSSFLETARVTAGYNPSAAAANTSALASQQHAAFNNFLFQVHGYYPFLSLEYIKTRHVINSSIDCERLVNDMTHIIQEAMGEEGRGVKDGIANTIRASADRVTRNVSNNSVVTVGYSNVNLPAPRTDRPNRDPATTLCFSIVEMTRTVHGSGKGATTSYREYLYIIVATYRMSSSYVSANASYLAGSTIIPPERAIVNFQSVG